MTLRDLIDGDPAALAGVIAHLLSDLDYKELKKTRAEYEANPFPKLTEQGAYSANALAMIVSFAEQFQEAGYKTKPIEKFGEEGELFES